MSEKNTKDEEVSKEETGDQKENKNLILIKKYAELAWNELKFILADIKNSSKKVSEENTAAKEIIPAEELPNQAKPSASELLKNQLNDFKRFWSYLDKKSKIFLFVVAFIVGSNIMSLSGSGGVSGGYSQSSSYTNQGGSGTGTVTRIDALTGNVSITGFSRVTVGKSTSVTVNGSRVRDEGDLMVGDRCVVRGADEMYVRNLVCTR